MQNTLLPLTQENFLGRVDPLDFHVKQRLLNLIRKRKPSKSPFFLRSQPVFRENSGLTGRKSVYSSANYRNCLTNVDFGAVESFVLFPLGQDTLDRRAFT
jgi:hypothetical protein